MNKIMSNEELMIKIGELESEILKLRIELLEAGVKRVNREAEATYRAVKEFNASFN